MKKIISLFLGGILLFMLSFGFEVNSEAATVKGFYYHSGDILVTKSTSFKGLTGHAGIVLPGGNTVLHIAGIGHKPSVISISKWLSLYPSTRVVRSTSMSKASNAAKWAKNYYANGKGKNTTYKITWNPKDRTYTYCSEIVWQAFYYGSGSTYRVASVSSQGLVNYITPSIIQPYDFTNGVNQKYNGFKTVYSVNW